MENLIKTELIENFMSEKKLSKVGFCKECKISVATLNKILRNNDNLRIIALFKIAKVMKINISDLFY